jgi:hypothetical protein
MRCDTRFGILMLKTFATRGGTPVRERRPKLRIPGEGDHDSEPMPITVPK